MTTPLYVSDLDGTLLDSNAQLSAYSRDTIQGLISDGMLFSAASARSVVTMRTCLEGLKLKLPIIEFSGAFISDLESGEHITINDMEKDVLETVFSLSLEGGINPFVSSFDGQDDHLHVDAARNDAQAFYIEERKRTGDPRLRLESDPRSKLGEHVVALTLIDKKSKLEPIQAVIEKDFASSLICSLIPYFYFPGWHWLIIQDRRSTKGNALKQLKSEYAPQADELVVFGDEINDLPMFEVADRAYATAGAIDVIKGAATSMIGSNDENAVARFLLEENTSKLSTQTVHNS